MTTAADHADDTLSPTNQQQFVHLANNLFELLQTAKRELDRDHAAAKASLATASSILQSEIERHSHTQGARPGALAAWQIARVQAFIDENLHRTCHANSSMLVPAGGNIVSDAKGRVPLQTSAEFVRTYNAQAHEIVDAIPAAVTRAQAGLNWLRAEPPNLEEVRQVLNFIASDGKRAAEIVIRLKALIEKVPTADAAL